MQKAIIVYSTDIHHTRTSKCVLGVFTDKQAAIDAISQQHAISEQQKINLWLFNQTQTYSDEETTYDGEFVLEDYTMNALAA